LKKMGEVFCFFVGRAFARLCTKEALFFFEKKNQKTFVTSDLR